MATRLMLYNVIHFGLSDIGLLRENNEDVWAAFPENKFFCLADGMGGHQAGEIASKEAVECLGRLVAKYVNSKKDSTLSEARLAVYHALEKTNVHVFKIGQSDDELRGMGTTICCLLFHTQGLIYANVGDSRIYRFRQNVLEQITRDHSLLRELVDLGQISELSSSDFLYKNIITKAIGTELKVEPSVYTSDVENDDIYMMCTDGLSDLVTQNEMQKVLNDIPDLEQAGQELANIAKQKGGHDNITIVLTKVQEKDRS